MSCSSYSWPRRVKFVYPVNSRPSLRLQYQIVLVSLICYEESYVLYWLMLPQELRWSKISHSACPWQQSWHFFSCCLLCLFFKFVIQLRTNDMLLDCIVTGVSVYSNNTRVLFSLRFSQVNRWAELWISQRPLPDTNLILAVCHLSVSCHVSFEVMSTSSYRTGLQK